MRYFVGLVFVAIVGAAPVIAQAEDYRSRYAQPFTPPWAAPQLEVRPPHGPPGSRVVITGSRFHRYVAVFFGDQPMEIVGRGDRHIVAVIPRHVRGEDFIYVVDDTGRARTFAPFGVHEPRGPWGRGPHRHGWPYGR